MTLIIALSRKLRKAALLSAILFMAMPFACREDGSVVPEFNSSNSDFSDTILEVSTTTVEGDSILTTSTSRNPLGKLNDAVFGLSVSQFFSQVRMSSSSLDIEDNIQFDSAVLYLAYDGFYGFPAEFDVIVNELTEDFESDSDYYSTMSIASSATELGRASLSIAETDTFGDSTYVLRIRLDDELADRIKGEGSFSSQSAWLTFFKGIRVSVDPAYLPSGAGLGEGAIVYFNLLSDLTKLSLYYQSSSSTLSEDFVIDSDARRFSRFDNEYSPALEALIGKEGEEFNFISAMSGPRTRITFPGVSGLSSKLGKIAVNKAELVIPYEDPEGENYLPPDRNLIIVKNSSNAWVLPEDYVSRGSAYFGGELDPVGKAYSFNLASTMDDIINKGNFERELYLTVSGSAVTANRLKLNSGIHGSRKMYMRLSYTKSS